MIVEIRQIYRKTLKVKNRLVFRIARKKLHQNFQAAKYDIKQHSDKVHQFQ